MANSKGSDIGKTARNGKGNSKGSEKGKYLHSSITNMLNKVLEEERAVKTAAEQTLRKTEKYKGKYLTAYRKNGKQYFKIVTTGSNRSESTYIGARTTQDSTIICERHVLQEIIRRVSSNEALLQPVIDGYKTINPNEFRENLPIAYRNIPRSIFALTHTINLQDAEVPASTDSSTAWHPESLKYRTTTGILVRSKNELLATYVFDKLNIRYVYEEPLVLYGFPCLADFKLIMPNGAKVLYVEIFGMMDDPEYRSNCAEKIRNYIAAGFTPDVDMLYLFCNSDGGIDLHALERFLSKWLNEAAA